MKDETIINYSRNEARKKMMALYPKISWYIHHVYHKDKNPLNNHIENLQIVTRSEHLKKHVISINKTASMIIEDYPCRFCGRMTFNLKCLCGRRKP